MRCPIIGCTFDTRPGQLMCTLHWRMVPREIQTAIWDTWRDVRFGGGDAQQRLTAISHYRDCRWVAIRSVNHQVGFTCV